MRHVKRGASLYSGSLGLKMSRAAGIPMQWQSVLAQNFSWGCLASMASLLVGLTAFVTCLSSIKYEVPLAPLNIGRAMEVSELPEKQRPRLTLPLCPNSNLVCLLLLAIACCIESISCASGASGVHVRMQHRGQNDTPIQPHLSTAEHASRSTVATAYTDCRF
jgi:hypothetical protein